MKGLLFLGLTLGAGYYLHKHPELYEAPPAPKPRRPVEPPPPKGSGPWRQKVGECPKTGHCTITWQNPETRTTQWATAQVTREAYSKLPDRVPSLSKLRKMPGVVHVTLED